MAVAKQVGSDEQNLGIHLGFESEDIKALQRDNKGSYHDLVYSILDKWNKGFGGPRNERVKRLCAAFKEIGRNDIATYITDSESAVIIYTSSFQFKPER